MGKKFPFDIAMKMGGIAYNPSIFNENNKHGYRININHPRIRPLYEEYHKHIGVPHTVHLTHSQRLRFEAIILKMLEKRGEVSVQQSDPDGQTDP